MAIGDTMYQFILDFHFSNHNPTIVMLASVICIPQVSYVHTINAASYTYELICDRASKNGPSGHKIHVIIKNLIS